jgi:CRP-like cAMP-binding protein
MRSTDRAYPAARTSSGVANFRNKLLASLPGEERQRIAAQLTTVPLKFRQVLYEQDQPIRDIYFPGGGACSIIKTMGDGATAEVGTVGDEGIIGSSVFFGDDRGEGTVIVQIGAENAYRMDAAAFIREMNERGAFYNRVIRYHQALVNQVMQTTACNVLHPAEQRCARWLLMTRDRVGSNDLKLTHEFLAFMLGVRRPTVTLVVGALQKAGLVETRRGTIVITNPAGLEASSCECYARVKAIFSRLLPELPGSSS